ncbi:MAG: hypothetical protein ACYDBB_14245 [Armatimonadota bacterium]
MPSLGTIFKLLRYVPDAISLTQSMRGKQEKQEVDVQASKTQARIEDMKKHVDTRVDELTEEVKLLRAHVNDVEAALSNLRVLVMIGGGVLALLSIFLLIEVVMLAFRAR